MVRTVRNMGQTTEEILINVGNMASAIIIGNFFHNDCVCINASKNGGTQLISW